MSIYEFMASSPVLSFFIALLIAVVLEAALIKVPNRILRSRNIQKNGWPPEHLDADGDFKKEED